jgi:hypothetical protein
VKYTLKVERRGDAKTGGANLGVITHHQRNANFPSLFIAVDTLSGKNSVKFLEETLLIKVCLCAGEKKEISSTIMTVCGGKGDWLTKAVSAAEIVFVRKKE